MTKFASKSNLTTKNTNVWTAPFLHPHYDSSSIPKILPGNLLAIFLKIPSANQPSNFARINKPFIFRKIIEQIARYFPQNTEHSASSSILKLLPSNLLAIFNKLPNANKLINSQLITEQFARYFPQNTEHLTLQPN